MTVMPLAVARMVVVRMAVVRQQAVRMRPSSSMGQAGDDREHPPGGNSPTHADVEGVMHPMRRTTRARGAVAAGLLGLALVLTGCGGAAEQEAADVEPTGVVATTEDSADLPATPDETPATGGSDVHTRLASALAPDNPLLSRQILAANPRIEERDLPEPISGWQAYEIIREDAPNIPPAVVAIDDNDRAVLLTAAPQNFAELTTGATVADEEQAAALAAGFLELTRDTARFTYPISSFADLRWASRLDADQVAIKEQAERDLGDRVSEPQVGATAEGWVVTSWTGGQDSIVRHETTVARDGAVSDSATTMAQGLPLQRTVGG